MLRNYLITALRNLSRNRLYATINIIGLAMAFAVAFLIVLFVRDELTYDTWIPDYKQTYVITQTDRVPGHPPTIIDGTYPSLAAALKLDFPSVEGVARLVPGGRSFFRHGNVEAQENVFWVDPNFFSVVRLKAIAGDLRTALDRPDGVVLTRHMARKYFGRDDPIGERIELNRGQPMSIGTHTGVENPPLQVTAVIEDLPSNTNLTAEIFLSGRAAIGGIRWVDDMHFTPDSAPNTVQTYVHLKPGASLQAIEQGFPAFLDRHLPETILGVKRNLVLGLLPIAKLHTSKVSGNATRPPADVALLYAMSAIGVLIIAIASMNFVNLTTARIARRAVEVGVRKATGADRKDIAVQFLSESTMYAVLGMMAGLALARTLLPSLNAYLGRTITYDLWRQGLLACATLGLAAVIGLLAGAYPASVLSAFRPAVTLRAAVLQPGGSGKLRNILVLIQFAVLIGFALATIVVWRQSEYATTQALRIDTDQVLIVESGYCNADLLGELRSLPGVRAGACSAVIDSNYYDRTGSIAEKDGSIGRFETRFVGPGLLQLYGLKPLAGRFFVAGRDHGLSVDQAGRETSGSVPIVINETALHSLGFASPQTAIGQTVSWSYRQTAHQTAVPQTSEIIGVSPNYALDSVDQSSRATFFVAYPRGFSIAVLKLSGRQIPETIHAIDHLWDENPHSVGPVTYRFLDQVIQDYYQDLGRQARLFAACAGTALFISALGLFGLAAFVAESRTKEIGIRKALGASRRDILLLMLWQFTKPVLWANVIAWPVAYVIVREWLEGFASHIALGAWMFFAASALAFVVAVLTVIGHALLVAHAKPVAALRYE